jgi:hypothetical protein
MIISAAPIIAKFLLGAIPRLALPLNANASSAPPNSLQDRATPETWALRGSASTRAQPEALIRWVASLPNAGCAPPPDPMGLECVRQPPPSARGKRQRPQQPARPRRPSRASSPSDPYRAPVTVLARSSADRLRATLSDSKTSLSCDRARRFRSRARVDLSHLEKGNRDGLRHRFIEK